HTRFSRDWSSDVCSSDLEDVRSDKSAVDTFQKNLDLQKQNVTEIGEIEATNLIVKHFKDLKENPEDSIVISSIRKDITELMRLRSEERRVGKEGRSRCGA